MGTRSKAVMLLAAVVTLLVTSRVVPLSQWFQIFLGWVESLGAAGPVVLVVAYVFATILFVPGLVLTVGAGVLFGLPLGVVTVSIGSTIGATAAFLLGRYFARDWVEKRIASNARFAAIDRAVAKEGWKIVMLTRLSPLFPFNLLNYAFGLTRVSLGHYVIASWLGMLPGTILYVYVGTLIGNLASLSTGDREKTPAEWAFLGVGFAAAIVVVFFVARLSRKALHVALD
jgi:uncharacterized membrane protein YdjX (TVP38/TMEM64 family)